MKSLFATFCILSAFALPTSADQIKLFGRSFDKSLAIYGSVDVPPDPTESARENAKFELYIKPSITLRKFSDTTSLVGYSIFALIGNAEGHDYDNKVTFLVGAEIQHRLSPSVRLSFGAHLKTEQEFITRVTRTRAILAADLNLYKTSEPPWIKNRMRDGSRLVLSGWANYRYPGSLHASEKDNGLLQGSLKLAVSMPYRDTRLAIAPFVSIKAKADHKGRAFNNVLEPALGVDLKIPFRNGGEIAVGTKAVYQWRHATGTSASGILGYVKWYKEF